ncbi:hypothetical protein LSUE1_G006252 [Lachnellula suecica]|uniref:Uncharacterized protein n=1 Tax=Lachnellula suecica TaxID=602035 RepID=A0A8T9CF45_9HELO|nr:hypothetical protein LSUE1_G006252 [Lachnellula suecica]
MESSGFEPLLFPFLILEAKSEKSACGFDDIQTQTAFPILALIKLQQDLQGQIAGMDSGAAPLVWFLANRGDAWRVYGCCMSEGETIGYDIFQLWDGSIMSNEGSLQLLLIVDYIFDWARDIYRPAILRQFKALITGDNYDQVSLGDDSDIFSMRRNISGWIQAPPSTIGDFEFHHQGAETAVVIDQQELLPMQIPNTKLGTLRSASIVHYRAIGLCITEDNVTDTLPQRATRQFAHPGNKEPRDKFRQAARDLINFIARWDELLLITEEDLDTMEENWTGYVKNTREPSALYSVSEFYTVVEMRSYIDHKWQVIRELAYLAVSEAAFNVLIEHANFKVKNPAVTAVRDAARPCSGKTFTEAMRCLKSGSTSRLLEAAISCTSIALYCIPERKRKDYVPPTQKLGFGKLEGRLPDYVQNFRTWDGKEKVKAQGATSRRRKKGYNQPLAGSEQEPGLDEPASSFLRASEK